MNFPDQVGNYKLEREIGRGATSRVWLGRHAHLEDHVVAVKLLVAPEPESLRRFRREAQIAARLRHPHIIQIYDFGFSASYAYTVIEYIEGGALYKLLEERGRLPLDEALRILRQIGSALDYAHGLGIIHRDISPGNILIADSGRRALLTDFGIARDAGQPITVASSLMGTPGYHSPEHARSAAEVTRLSDLYSLGVVFYQMLSGQMPWDRVPALNEGPGPAAPAPLRERGVAGLPAQIDKVLARLLDPDQTRRFPTAQAAVTELERLLAHHTSVTQVAYSGVRRPAPVEYQSGGVETNAVEAVLGPGLLQAPIDRAHRRADELREPAAIAALLDAWSARDRLGLRRRMLGRLARLHKVSSHNLYFYRLRVLYEYRSPIEVDVEPDYKQQVFPLEPERDRWQVGLPAIRDFSDQPGERVLLPGSARVVACETCSGAGLMVCPRCKGKQRIYVSRPAPAPVAVAAGQVAPAAQRRPAVAEQRGPVAPPSAASSPGLAPRAEQALVPCPECSGRGGITCTRCAGAGRLVQRGFFRWRRFSQILKGQDSLPGLNEEWLAQACQAEVIYTTRQPGGFRPEWSLVPGLAPLIAQAQQPVDPDTRVALAEVHVSFIPLTDIVFDLGKPGDHGLYKLSIYGFENVIPPDWRFLNWERVASLCVIIFLCVIVAILLIFTIV